MAMITILMFLSLWIATAKDLRAANYMRWGFVIFLIVTAVFNIDRIYLLAPLAIFVGFAVYGLFAPERDYYIKRKRAWKKKWIAHPSEALAYHSAVWLFRLLPFVWLSAISGKLLETVGPYTKAHKIARRNLEVIMPENNNKEFLKKMWNNWGRTFGESLKFTVYKKNLDKYISFKNRKLFDDMNKNHRPYLVCAPHSGNIGVATLAFLGFDAPVGITYKFPSNPLMNDAVLENYGSAVTREIEFIPVGSNAMHIFRTLLKGGVVNINPDQRINDGEILQFFGHPAKTSVGVARIALKLDIPILIAHVRRVDGPKHEIVYDEVLRLPKTGDDNADGINGMQMINDALERAARHHPSEYLWMHRRWGRI